MDKYGFQTRNVSKHFMIANDGCCSGRDVIFGSIEEIETCYRIWSGNKVSEIDIEGIRLLETEPFHNFKLYIGNLTTHKQIRLEQEEDWYESCYTAQGRENEKVFDLNGMYHEAVFISETKITNTPNLALDSYVRYADC